MNYVILKSRVKSHVRARGGHLEMVKEHVRNVNPLLRNLTLHETEMNKEGLKDALKEEMEQVRRLKKRIALGPDKSLPPHHAELYFNSAKERLGDSEHNVKVLKEIIEGEILKSRVKGFTRTRKGKREFVTSFERKDIAQPVERPIIKDWLTEGTTWDVVQEWRRRYPNYSDSKTSTQDMRAILAGTKIIARYKSNKFIVTTKAELDKHNAAVREMNRKIREETIRRREKFFASPEGKEFAEQIQWISNKIIPHIKGGE